jgi:hypothetical protein
VDVDIINGQLLSINDTKELASVRSPLTPTQIIHYDKLTGELSGLYNSLSHDGNALQALDKLILEIIDMSTEILPEKSRVDVLVVPSGGKYHCPFAGCRKKDAGWALSRDARDHIWIHHLSRRLTCPWNDWCVSPSRNRKFANSAHNSQTVFSRKYDRDRHMKAHNGLGEKFVCTKWLVPVSSHENARFTDSLLVTRYSLRNSTSTDTLRRSVIDQGANLVPGTFKDRPYQP